MSVPVNQRNTGKLEVCLKAHDLCVYTLRITSNEKTFSPTYAAFTQRIAETAIEIHTKVWSANNVMVRTREEYILRHTMQEEAGVMCNILLSYIEIAHSLYHLSTKRVKYWADMIINTRALIRAWRDSDAKRYAEYR